MFKKIIVIALSWLILLSLFLPLTVSADDSTTNSNYQLFSASMFDDYLHDYDLSKYDYSVLDDYIDKTNMIIIDPSFTDKLGAYIRFWAFDGNHTGVTNIVSQSTSLYFDDLHYYSFFFNGSTLLSSPSNLGITSNGDYLFSVCLAPGAQNSAGDDIILVSDVVVYQALVDRYPDNANQIYLCPNPFKAFKSYLDSSLKPAKNFYDVAQSKYNNFIWFYDWYDSYKGKYDYDMYTDILSDVYDTDDLMLNYLSSSVTFKDDLYYTTNMTSNFNSLNAQHSENLTFYLKFNDDMQRTLNDKHAVNSSLKYSDVENEILSYLTSNTYAIHYEKGELSFNDWYSDYIVSKWLNGATFKLHSSDEYYSDDETVSSNSRVWYLTWIMPNTYSFVGATDGSGSSVMTGCRTASSAKLFDPSTGKVDNSSGGLGSNIDTSDLGKLKDKSDLLNNGWKNGYPNQSGNYPYRITMYKNGTVLMMIYFKRKPTVVSYAYTDTQIRYAVNIADVPGYAYIPQYNISYQFDVASLNNALTSAGSSIEKVSNALSSGLDVASIAKGSLTVDVVSLVVDLVSFLNSLNNDVDKFVIDYNLYLWTNYVGNTNGYKGYRCIFNWDIGVDDAFIRDNSDDNHYYSDDYVKDLVPGTEVPTGGGTGGNTYIYNYYYYDNNGNVHGGGDDTYTPVEQPTGSDLIYGNNSNFDFNASTLWNYGSSFMSFCANAFSIFPFWIWSLLASGVVIVIVLRLLGR